MAAFEIRNRKGEAIHDLNGWKTLASPASATHWKPHRSALELARSWLSEHGPDALREVLEQKPGTSNFAIELGVAEAQTHFDQFGGPRNHDLLLVGQADGGRTVVAIEGKADERFGQTLEGYRSAAVRRTQSGKRTNAPQRLRGLTTAVAGWEVADNPSRLRLRYQLFSAVAGTLAAAVDEQADQAVLLVQEFVTPQTSERNRKTNEDDLRRFLDSVFHSYSSSDASSWLVGPVSAFGGTKWIPSTMPLYIGKTATTPVGEDH